MDYTNLYDFQKSTGIIVPNDSSVLLGIQQKFQEIFGTDIDLSAETPVGRLIEALAVTVKTTLGVTAQTANQFNINEATGIYLDAIAQIYNIKRIAGTKTKIQIKCYFSDNTSGTDTIPAGSLIMCPATGDMFSIDNAIANNGSQQEPETGRIYAVGTATCVKSGPIVAPAGSVTSIQTSVMGWVGVTNVGPTYIGSDIETDEAFRKRIMESRPIGIGFNTHLMSSLNRMEGVYSNCVLENNTGSDKVEKGVIIPPHSIFIAINCIETEDLYFEIAKAIANAKPIGVGMVKEGIIIDGEEYKSINNGDGLTVSYGYNNGYYQTINFYKAKDTAVQVYLTYSTGKYTGANIEQDIADTIADYMNTVGVGGTVHASMISNALINNLNIGVGTINVQKSGSGQFADIRIDMNGYEYPYTLPEHITMSLIQ